MANPEKLVQLMQQWADGKATLKDVRGYTDEELYAVARTAHVFFNQGRVNEARVIYQGLFAVNPRDPYFARALAVVEYAAGNADGALAAWEVAIRLSPEDPAGYMGRAEILIAQGQRARALEDLKRATFAKSGDARVKARAKSILGALSARL